MRRRCLKWIGIALGVCVALVAALLIAFQLAVGRVPEYRVQLQDWLSAKTELSIEFTQISARLRAYGPELAFDDVTVRSPDRTRVLATARSGSVAFDLWTSVRTGRLTAGRLTLDSPQLGLIRTKDGRIQIAGYSALAKQLRPFALEDLPIGRFRVRDARVALHDEVTGRGPWQLTHVNFALLREPRLLQVQGHTSLPPALGSRLAFSARLAGALETPQHIVSRVHLDGESLDLSGWADTLPTHWSMPQAGRGSLQIDAVLRGSQLQSAAFEAKFNDLNARTPAWHLPLPMAQPLQVGSRVRHRQQAAEESADAAALSAAATTLPTPPPTRVDTPMLLAYERVYARGKLEREDERWSAHLTALDLTAAADVADNRARDWRSRHLSLEWSQPGQGRFSVRGKADAVRLESITPLLSYLTPSTALARVRALDLRGTVRNASFEAQREDPHAPLAYSVSATAEDLGFDPVLEMPGVTGLSGRVQANEREGSFALDTGGMVLSIPWMFRWPLDAQALRAQLTWRDDGQAWHIGSEHLAFVTDDGRGEARLSLRVPHDGSSPFLDISAQTYDLKAAATPKYLPASHLSEAALAWLDRAFVDGLVPHASLELHGPTRSFPFREGGGEFRIDARVENVTFDYQPGWTPATQVSGQLQFRNEGMQANAITAQVGELQVTQAGGGFADFKEAELKIAASASGDLGAALNYLQTSPIGDALGSRFAALRGQGQIDANVSLLLPIKQIEERRVSVSTKLTNATVRLAGLDAPLTRLHGSFIVRQQLPVEADMHGYWLGGPVNVVITPDDGSDENATLVAQGRMTAARMSAFVPPAVQLTGATQWRLATRLTSRPQRGPQLFQIDSSLQGLGIDLPYPVGKAADATRVLHVDLEHSDRQLLARASLGELRALLRLQPERGGWEFERGSVRADGVLAALPDHPGLRLEGSVDRLRLDDWFALAQRPARRAGQAADPARDDRKVSDILRAANLHVGLLQLYGYEWPDVRGVVQATAQGWRVDVTGANAEGRILVPEDFRGTQPLKIDLERLVILRSKSAEGARARASATSDPRAWPSLQVHIGDMHVESHPIGGVDLLTRRVADGLRIESLSIEQDALTAQAQGEWLIGPEGERSRLTANITSTDARATLRALNYTEFLEAERASVSAQLTWPGGFDGSLLERASGTLQVSAESGQLLMLQPGAGRVLGLFSVAALPRRLSLDFSDLTEKGLSFDTIHGDFELREGNAFTQNLLLRGPAAEIGVAGRTGLGTQDFDQTAVVTGNLGASLPVAGALAGGPAIGAALLFFSQVFKEPLKGIARGYYRITGTWDEPIVERVDSAEAKDAEHAEG